MEKWGKGGGGGHCVLDSLFACCCLLLDPPVTLCRQWLIFCSIRRFRTSKFLLTACQDDSKPWITGQICPAQGDQKGFSGPGF